MKTIAVIPFVLAARLLAAQVDPYSNDPHFASPGRFKASALVSYSTETPPPAIIGDVVFGLSKRISLGVTAGTTGALGILGFKANGILVKMDRFKMFSRFLSVFTLSATENFPSTAKTICNGLDAFHVNTGGRMEIKERRPD